MARPLLMFGPDSWNPVINRGNRGECILRTDDDRFIRRIRDKSLKLGM